MTTKERQDWTMERLVMGAMVFIVTGVLAWAGVSLSSQNVSIAVMHEKLSSLENKVEDFTKRPRFTHEDFKLEMRIYESRVKIIELELKNRSAFMARTGEDISRMDKRITVIEGRND